MTPLRALLVDDERLARKRLAGLLVPHPEIVVVGEADGVETAVVKVEELRPDVVFLDVEMAPENGLDLLAKLPEEPERPAVIFVTAYENFAVQAFDVCALDYLLKPVHPERLAMSLRRLLSMCEDRCRATEAPQETWTMECRVTLSDRHTLRVVEVREIVAIQAMGAYSRVSLREIPAMVVLRSISEWERRLPSGEFSRIERSLIVQTGLLRAMERRSRDEALVVLEGFPESLTIGRTGAIRLRKLLDGEG